MSLRYILATCLSFSLAATSVPARAQTSFYDQTVLQDRPVMFLRMDTPGAGVQADISGGGNNGSYRGGTPGVAVLPNGERAASFNGRTQYLTVPHARELSVPTSGVITIESWIKPAVLNFPDTENEGFVYWLGKGNPSDGYEYANRMYSKNTGRPNRISVYSWNPSGGLGSGAYFQDTVSTSQWIHVVDVINMRDRSPSYPTGYISIYKNGVRRGKVRLDQYDVIPRSTPAPFNVGTRNFNSYFQGAVGKVAVYDYELSPSQISRHYSAMTSGPTAGGTPPPGGGPGGDPSAPVEPAASDFLASQRFLSPSLADGINDAATFGPAAEEVTIIDPKGREVFHATKSGGSIAWDGRDGSGRIVAAGVYIARIRKQGGGTAYQSLAVVK